MRASTTTAVPFALAAIIACAACGGAPPPPASSASGASDDTSSLEKGSAAKEAKEESAEEAASPHTTAAAPAPSKPAPAPAAAAEEAAPAVYHPAPSVTGSIDGKAFTPKVARVTSPVQKDGRITLAVTESTECPASGDGSDTALTVTVPWQKGYKVDVSALKLPGKKGPAEIAFTRVTGGKKDVSTTFKPSGTVTVVTAPDTKGATGKLKVDIQSGDYMLAGTLDVLVCVSPK